MEPVDLLITPRWLLPIAPANVALEGHAVAVSAGRIVAVGPVAQLEARFDARVRVLAAAIFIVWRLGWMATAIYVPCLAINAATNGRADLTTMILVTGALVTLYTMLGGIQAVIWNDVIQFCIMFGGLAATVWISLTHVPGGLAEIWTAASQAGKTSFAAPLVLPAGAGLIDRVRVFFEQPVNVIAILCAIVFGRMATERR